VEAMACAARRQAPEAGWRRGRAGTDAAVREIRESEARKLRIKGK
jgi:hypothetical protein